MSVVAMSAAFAGGAAAVTNDDLDTISEGERYWQGEVLYLEGIEEDDGTTTEWDDDEVALLDDDDSLVREIAVRTNDDGGDYIRLNTESLDGSYSLDDNTNTVNFSVNDQDLGAEFSADNATLDSTVDLDVTSARNNYELNLTVDDVDADDVADALGLEDAEYDTDSDNEVLTILEASSEEEWEVSFDSDNFSAEEYDFEFEAVDTGAEATATINLQDLDSTLLFSENTFDGTEGDIVDITFDIENYDAFDLTLEEEDVDDPYQLNASITHIDDDLEDDQLTLQFNTAEAGDFDSNPEDILTSEDADVDVTDEELPSGFDYDDGDRIAPSDYELELFEEGEDDEDDVAFLALQERSSTDLTNWIASSDDIDVDDLDADDLLDDATERNTVAEGDLLITQVEADGLNGYISDASDFNTTENGIYFNISDTDDPRFGEGDYVVFDNDADGMHFVNDLENGQFFIVMEDDEIDQLEADETWESSFEVTEDNPYVASEDDEELLSEEFTLEERDLEVTGEFDDDDALLVENSNEAELTAETNVAPGTEVEYRLRHATGVSYEYADVGHDNQVTVEVDLSDYEAGDEFDLRVRDQVESSNSDSVEAVIIDADEEEPAEANLDWNVDVDPAEPVEGDDVDVTVSAENLGDETGSAAYEFVFDGDTLLSGDDVELEGGESDSWSDTVEDAPAGDYDWELIVDGDVESEGTLTVEEADDEPADDDATDDDAADDDAADDDAADDDAADDDGEADDGDDDGTPGFGVAVAVVALLAAAMLALRRQN
ncbi:BGTF surface domain-containing protein [Natronorubrum sulfidifaciens]